MHAAVSEVALDGVVLEIAVAAVQLQATVDDVEALGKGGGGRGGDERATAKPDMHSHIPCS